MSQFVLEELSDFRDFFGSEDLTDILDLSNNEHKTNLSNVRVSPDGRHIHIILRKPKVSLMTFDKYERPQLAQNQKKLDLWPPRAVPIVNILYLDQHGNSIRGSVIVVAVIYENGKIEFWKFQESKTGWHLLQTSDLCNSPRAKVVSVCACSNLFIWCEERPPSESSPSLSSTKNKLRYCVCKRDFEVEDGVVILGGVKITLHNNPKFNVTSSGEHVHLLPDCKTKPQLSISKFFLTWSLRHDSFTVNTTCKNTPIRKLSAKESDFKKLVTDCLGYLSALQPPDIHYFSSTGCGGLLLLLSTGWLCFLQKDGVLRQVYKLADNCPVKHGTHVSLCVHQNVVALILGQTLRLIDLNCGRELEKVLLKSEALLYLNRSDGRALHLLSETGLFAVLNRETGPGDYNTKKTPLCVSAAESIRPEALLVEAVFEEACKYYQQRSLSSTQLTVDTLKKGGRFQAPISLASILRSYLSGGLRKGSELLVNGGDECVAGQDKLMLSLEGELKALVSLEEVKESLVKGNEKEVEELCETLVEKEVLRLLASSELDKEALLYLNSIFNVFPRHAWKAAEAALQLHRNGEGRLSSRAPQDIWRSVLSSPNSTSPCIYTNGRLKKNHALKADGNHRSKPGASNSPLPVFELLCRSVYHFQPGWLPGFLQLAQQQQGSAGLGLSLAASSWSFPGGRGAEGGENNAPLYKRALFILSGLNIDRDQYQELEVELLLVSGRPNAILQALRILMSKQQWERVTQVAQQFSKQSPLLNKEIFTTLLCEVANHRDLDPYLDLLWALCPEDFTVTTILNLLMKYLPSPNTSGPSSSSFSISCSAPSPPAPFADPKSGQLSIGPLKPLLRKVLQRETKPSQRYADILQSPMYPPAVLPRHPTESIQDPDVTPASHTAAQSSKVTQPANPADFS